MKKVFSKIQNTLEKNLKYQNIKYFLTVFRIPNKIHILFWNTCMWNMTTSGYKRLDDVHETTSMRQVDTRHTRNAPKVAMVIDLGVVCILVAGETIGGNDTHNVCNKHKKKELVQLQFNPLHRLPKWCPWCTKDLLSSVYIALNNRKFPYYWKCRSAFF